MRIVINFSKLSMSFFALSLRELELSVSVPELSVAPFLHILLELSMSATAIGVVLCTDSARSLELSVSYFNCFFFFFFFFLFCFFLLFFYIFYWN